MPKTQEDFGDGGAFPEVMQAQYPLGMGKGSSRQGSGSTLALQVRDFGRVRSQWRSFCLQVDADGRVQYDAIARVGQKDKVVYTKLADQRGQFVDENDPTVQKPDDEAVTETTLKTRQALEKLTQV